MFTAPAVAQVNLTVHKEVLPNGLTVLLHPNKQAPTVSCRLFYVTGSVHEVPGKSGLAHILEHELFKGTKKVGITDSIADAKFMATQDSLQALIRPAILAGDTATVKKLTAEHDSVVNEHRKIFVKDELWSAYQAERTPQDFCEGRTLERLPGRRWHRSERLHQRSHDRLYRDASEEQD